MVFCTQKMALVKTLKAIPDCRSKFSIVSRLLRPVLTSADGIKISIRYTRAVVNRKVLDNLRIVFSRHFSCRIVINLAVLCWNAVMFGLFGHYPINFVQLL